ncbi:SxtJ family membrane protein [Synechococcus sp. NOUM97013]|uniref:SxtJ family membrane protein n=1 Tax=Synechococcus sp. NOUM97013 TaxID=1442555 RepID=UPI0021032A17|nr:SxtJ family membrane protein [Synechococcus sp. NOUM97013]
MSLPTIPKASEQQLRNFGLTLGLFLPLVFSLIWPWLHNTASPTWPIVLGSLCIAMGLIAPKQLQRPYGLWMLLGHGLGWINSHLILGLIYLVVLQPIAIAMRLLGHDPLRRSFKPELDSYRESCADKTVNLERPF